MARRRPCAAALLLALALAVAPRAQQAPARECPDCGPSGVLSAAPRIAPSGTMFYTGDRFPAWQGDLFVGALRCAALHRLIFNARGLLVGHQSLLWQLRQRIREVRQGPDGLIYLLTDENDGALLRIEPV